MVVKMVLLLQWSPISELVGMMNLQVQIAINMDLNLQTRGSKGGGLLSDKVVQTGGSISSRTCVNLE